MVAIYDAAIIGAGADGLAAATLLARAGHKTIVLERGIEPGGRCRTREIHPGFRASPYADELAPIPPELFWELALARHGVLYAANRSSLALWEDKGRILEISGDLSSALLMDARKQTAALLANARNDTSAPPRWRAGRRSHLTWPPTCWSECDLAALVRAEMADEADAAHLAAIALTGRAADPFLPGSALHLLAPGVGQSGLVRGGLGAVGHALATEARDAGAEVSCGLEVSDVRHARGRAKGIVLADGTEIYARAIVSTLDLKRTFLSLFAWNSLPPALSVRVNAFRTAGSTARLLIALESMPPVPAGLPTAALSGPIFIKPSIAAFATAHTHWRAGALAETLPIAIRFPQLTDPSLAPVGAATMTATIGAIPYRLFDGAWTHEKRDLLQERILAAIDAVLPGTAARIVACSLLVPPDMEDELALTDGDLWGGEIAPDQMAGLRPGPVRAPRTPVRGLYLAGASTTAGVLASCASGAAAASAIIADFGAGLLR